MLILDRASDMPPEKALKLHCSKTWSAGLTIRIRVLLLPNLRLRDAKATAADPLAMTARRSSRGP